MPKDYPRAIKWITREIEDLEETIRIRTEAQLTLYNFPTELETMKEIKEILENFSQGYEEVLKDGL